MKYGSIILAICLMVMVSAVMGDQLARRGKKSVPESDPQAEASLTKARDLIDQRKFSEAEKYIRANDKLISRVDGDHVPKMQDTIVAFHSIEKMIASAKWTEAEKILTTIAEKKCCKLKYDIYPNAIKYYQALIKNKDAHGSKAVTTASK